MDPTAHRRMFARRASILKKLLFLALLILVGVGFYRGWIALSKSGDDQSGKVTLTVDPDKARADAEKVKDKSKELSDKARDTAK
jgi:hypothetical protein